MQIQSIKTKEWAYQFELEDGTLYKTNIIIVGKIINRMKKKYSPIVLICGGQRMGKSFVAVWLAYKILKIFHFNTPFDVSRHTFYDPIDAIKHLQDMEKEPMIIDEAGSLLNKTDWYTRITKAFDKIIQTQGYKCNCYIFVSPFGSDIAKTFRKHFDYIIYVRKKGLLKVKQVPKNYDDLTGKMSYPYMLEQIKLTKKAVPKSVWNNYEQFSFKKKEEIREQLVLHEQLEKKDRFGRPLRRGEDVKNGAS